MQKENWFIVWFNQWYQWIFYQKCLNRNQPGQNLQVTFHGFFQIKFTFWYKIQKIDLDFVFWQLKLNKFICICVLTGKIQQIDLNFCFDMKIQMNLFEFVFWQRKSIWSIFTGYLSNLLFDRENPENSVEFCVLTGKIK